MTLEKNKEQAIFAGGCFWCTEALFLQLEGVIQVLSGYIGGHVSNPTYKEICSGETGHAEAIQITFERDKISYGELLEIFFSTHDPTTLNRQGNDVGPQYRSEIFFMNESQQRFANDYINLLNTACTFEKPIVTKVSPATVFYVAEEYHQNYYNQNKSQGYCSFVINQKITKLHTN